MNALIDNIIPKQGFEIVLERIACIILLELKNQKTLQNFSDVFSVWTERQSAFDKSEDDVMISVGLDSINFNGQTQHDTQGLTTFFIDIYSTGVETKFKSGDDVSRERNLKFAGMIRYIFGSTQYKTLNFAPGLIGGVYVNTIQNQLNYGQDADFIKFSRVSISVRIQENSQMWEAIELLGNDTTIKFDNTDKGITLTFNT